jgi:hypothetical protein
MTEVKKAGRGRAKTLIELRREAERAADALKKGEEREAAREADEQKKRRAQAEDAAITKALPRLLRSPKVREFLLKHLNSEAEKGSGATAPTLPTAPDAAGPNAAESATKHETPAADAVSTPVA